MRCTISNDRNNCDDSSVPRSGYGFRGFALVGVTFGPFATILVLWRGTGVTGVTGMGIPGKGGKQRAKAR